MVFWNAFKKKIGGKVLQKFILFVVILLSFFMLVFFIKGDRGKPFYYQAQSEQNTNVGGPFESSNSTSRYALTQAMVENKTVVLTEQQAAFASPDVSRYNDKFLSIFMPGISFIGVPFYLLGQSVGMQQLFTYFSVTLFGFFDMLLIAVIAYRLGVNIYASILAGFVFLFATNALSYSLFYTQHSTTVALLLLSILTVMGKRTVVKTVLFGLFAGAAFLLDIPNVFLLLPVGIYLLIQHITIRSEDRTLKFSFNTKLFSLFVGLIPFLIILMWYNLQATGTFTKIGQTIGRTNFFSRTLTKAQIENQQKNPAKFTLPFNSRAQLNGMYTLLVSNERSWFYYSPIVLLGVLGLITLYKEKNKLGVTNTLVSIVLMNILLYSMFGDPWGGWAFGPRYLIPAAAILCIGVGLAIQKYKSRWWFFILFAGTAIYSLFINSVGALTSSLIPPRIEAIHFDPPIAYTYEYNIQLVNKNDLSSLLYNVFLPHTSGWIYIFSLTSALAIIAIALYFLAMSIKERNKYE